MLIELNEVGPAQVVALTPAQASLLVRRPDVVTARLSPYAPNLWELSAAGLVGAARIGDIEIHIAPKLAVSRLLFLAGYASHGVSGTEDMVSVSAADDLVAAIGQALCRQVARAIHQGLLPGYVLVEETSPILRGRLLETVQLHRRHGLAFPLEIQHDEFTIDIAENQILRTACERMLQVPRLDAQSRHRLRRLLREFTDVTTIPRGSPIPAWRPTRLNARYQPALRLAELVLRATSVEHGRGGVAVTGFLLDMPMVYEDFVTVALREALVPVYGGRVLAQDTAYFLDEARRVSLRPDIVWYRDGTPVAVADAKYKVEHPTGYPNADIYQMLAYCTALHLQRGHLVYAKGAADPLRHVVREAGIEIVGHALDLDCTATALLHQVDGLAGVIAAECAYS